MSHNAVVATIKSVLHASNAYTRESAAQLAETIAQFVEEHYADLVIEYADCSDSFEAVEAFTRDYLSAK